MNALHSKAAARLEAHLEKEIPLTGAMQLSVVSWDGQALEVAAPLAPNRNHKATAFGGSLYSLAVAACWGWFTLRLWEEELDCDIVIQQATASYLNPVGQDFTARCAYSDDGAWRSLTAQLQRRGRARMTLEAEVLVGETPAFRLCGDFVALSSRVR